MECFFPLDPLQLAQPVERRQERVGPLVIPQNPINDPTTGGDNLNRYSDDPMEKPTKLHGQKLIPMLPSAYQQSEPGFQRPSQSRHHHIGPVGYQIIHRHPQRLETVLKLLNEVFLVAPLIAEPHHLGRAQIRSIGDVDAIRSILLSNFLRMFPTHTTDI